MNKWYVFLSNELIRRLFVSEQGAGDADMSVMFQPSEEAKVLSLIEAAALGYHVSLRGSRLTLRCPYSSPLSNFVKVLTGDVCLLGITEPVLFNYLVDAVCGCFCFFPGQRSGFRDCQSSHPVP